MPGVNNDLLNVLPLVKTGVVHDDDRVVRERRQEQLCDPGVKNITVNRTGKESDRYQGKA